MTAAEILADAALSDEEKFGRFRELIEAGGMSNKEVVDSVLHLVSNSAPPPLR